MALIKCPECGQEVSDRASVCPKCAFPLSELKTDGDVKIKYTIKWPYRVGVLVKNLTTGEIIFEEGRKGNVYTSKVFDFHVPSECEIGFSFDTAGYFNMMLNSGYWVAYPIKFKVKPGKKYQLTIVPTAKKANFNLQSVDVIDSD